VQMNSGQLMLHV